MSYFKSLVQMILLLAILSPVVAEAACNPPGGSWLQVTQHFQDRRFEETTCNAWKWVNGATRSYNVDTCSTTLFSGYQAKMAGVNGAGAVRAIYQDITLGSASHFSVAFHVNLQGSMSNWDRLRVTIRNPATNAELETVTVVAGNQSSLDCSQISKTLSGNYSNQTIRVYFEATIVSGSASDAFVLDEVLFYTAP